MTAWPASDELSRPWLGYVGQPFRVLRVEDFSPSQVKLAARGREYYDVLYAFSTKYQPPHPFLENWKAWEHFKTKFFGYHRDLIPEEIAKQVGGNIAYHKKVNGQWIAIITIERETTSETQSPTSPANDRNAF